MCSLSKSIIAKQGVLTHKVNNRGFAIIELVVAMLILGVMIGGISSLIRQQDTGILQQDVHPIIPKVTKAIASYVIKNGQFPPCDKNTECTLKPILIGLNENRHTISYQLDKSLPVDFPDDLPRRPDLSSVDLDITQPKFTPIVTRQTKLYSPITQYCWQLLNPDPDSNSTNAYEIKVSDTEDLNRIFTASVAKSTFAEQLSCTQRLQALNGGEYQLAALMIAKAHNKQLIDILALRKETAKAATVLVVTDLKTNVMDMANAAKAIKDIKGPKTDMYSGPAKVIAYGAGIAETVQKLTQLGVTLANIILLLDGGPGLMELKGQYCYDHFMKDQNSIDAIIQSTNTILETVVTTISDATGGCLPKSGNLEDVGLSTKCLNTLLGDATGTVKSNLPTQEMIEGLLACDTYDWLIDGDSTPTELYKIAQPAHEMQANQTIYLEFLKAHLETILSPESK
tara:strand:+ start:3977 stop:5341 length:1365 start_codon:yes stop_codon:yes gene_type:complete